MRIRPLPLVPTRGSARARPRVRWREQLPAWLFLLPALVVFATFTWYPIAVAVGYSFQHIGLHGDATWAGLDNYRRMFADPLFYTAWKNTLNFVLLSLALGFFAPVVGALMINEMRRMSNLCQLLYCLPTLIPVPTEPLLRWNVWRSSGSSVCTALSVSWSNDTSRPSTTNIKTPPRWNASGKATGSELTPGSRSSGKMTCSLARS